MSGEIDITIAANTTEIEVEGTDADVSIAASTTTVAIADQSNAVAISGNAITVEIGGGGVMNGITSTGASTDGALTAFNGTAAGVIRVATAAEIREGFKVAFGAFYSELTYTAGNLTGVGIWDTAAKLVKQYTKTLTYVADDLTQVVTVDELATVTLTSVLAYSGGDLANVTGTVS